MASSRPSRVENYLVVGVLLLLLVAVLLVAGLGGASLGVRYGLVRAPAMHVELGPIQVVAQTSIDPNCNPRDVSCMPQGFEPDGMVHAYYTVWVVTTQKVTSSNGPQQYGGVRLFSVQAGR